MLERGAAGARSSSPEPLMAFKIDEGHDGDSTIVFASTRNEAKYKGASMLGIDYLDIVSCTRAPDLDTFAPGPVPALVLMRCGWWFECAQCRATVGPAMDGAAVGVDGPREDAGAVYCGTGCMVRSAAHDRARAAAENALVEIITTRYPDATEIRTRVFSDVLVREGEADHGPSWATFRLPGLKHSAGYVFGSSALLVSKDDVDACGHL